MNSAGSRSDWVFGVAAVTTGLGVLSFVLFPFALPFVALLLPLLLPGVVLGVLLVILVGMGLGVRAATRSLRRLGRGPRAQGISRTGSGSAAHRGERRLA
jgi:hypothetical protein